MKNIENKINRSFYNEEINSQTHIYQLPYKTYTRLLISLVIMIGLYIFTPFYIAIPAFIYLVIIGVSFLLLI